MAKHRKTRREKKVADHRHSLYHLELESSQEVIKPSLIKENSSTVSKVDQPNQAQVISYAYVTSDLKKTIFITSIILLTQIVLFFILNRV
jgi:hypothetical protein